MEGQVKGTGAEAGMGKPAEKGTDMKGQVSRGFQV